MSSDLDSWTDRPSRATIVGLRRPGSPTRAVLTSCRRPIGSRSSTTTARSGARSRCRSSSTSSCAGSPRWRQTIRRCGSSSRGRPPTSGDHHWIGAAMVTSTTAVTTRTCSALMGAMLGRSTPSSVEEYDAAAASVPRAGRHPTLGRGYRTCAYEPMVELLQYLEAQRVHQLHRLGWRPGLHAPGHRGALRHPPERVIGSALGLDLRGGERRDESSTRRAWSSSTTGRRSRSGSGAGSVAARSWPWATPTGTSRCCAFAGRPGARPCGCSSGTTTRSASSRTTPGPRRRSDVAAKEGWTVVSMKTDWTTVFDQPGG